MKLDYKFLYPLVSHSMSAAKISTLFHIIKTSKETRLPISCAERLLPLWRGRLNSLRDEGLSILQNKSVFMTCYNCTPSMVKTDKDYTYRCHRSSFCPWCYADYVTNVYKRIRNSLMPSIAETKPFNLILARKLYKSRIDEEIGQVASLVSTFQKKAVKLFNAAGAYTQYVVNPDEQSSCDLDIHSRLIILPSSTTTIPSMHKWSIKTVQIGSESGLAKVVGTMLKYPRGLLVGDAFLTKEWLELKFEAIHRTCASYGVFRGANKGV